MRKLVIFFVVLTTFNMEAQSLKTLTDKAEKTSESVDQSSFIDTFAKDQVKKLTKKLNLSAVQQNQVSDLVVSQLKSEKFKSLIGSFSPKQLLSGSANEKVSDALQNDPDFKNGMDKILTEDQKKIAKETVLEKKN